MFKNSKFNKIYDYGNRVCVYNSNTGLILKIKSRETAENILVKNNVDENTQKLLLDKGFGCQRHMMKMPSLKCNLMKE